MKTIKDKIASAHRIFLALFCLLLLSGCVLTAMTGNPGYEISMMVPIIQKDDIDSIKKTIEKQNYILNDEIEKDGRIFLSYRKDISTPNRKITRPYIFVWISFNKERMTIFRIEIRNEWSGQESLLKHEMDRIADIIYSELKSRVGQENITIDRRPVGQPF